MISSSVQYSMQPITTRFTKLLNITTPIISAPMAFASTADMATAVTSAGGFGFVAAAFDSTEKIKETFQSIRTTLGLSANVPVPIGIGFIGWILDKTESSDDPRIDAALDELPTAVWFAFGTDLGKYIDRVHAHDAKRAHKTLVFVIVNSVEEALRATNEWKVDVLVAQGIEAGGHGGAEAPPLLTLLQAILIAIPDGPPVIATGGVSTGAQIASLLTMGAAGVALGTRFLFTPECSYTSAMKSVLLNADFNATARSMAFDEVNRTMGWPPKHDGRAIANDIISDYTQGLGLEERMKKFDESKARGDKNRLVIWAGVGAGLTNEIKGASNVVHELHDEALKALRSTSLLIE